MGGNGEVKVEYDVLKGVMRRIHVEEELPGNAMMHMEHDLIVDDAREFPALYRLFPGLKGVRVE